MTSHEGHAPPPADALPDTPPDGADLCTACGLCCTGLLFDIAPLEERELGLADQLRLPLACTQHHDAFRLPCPRQEEKRCTVYAMRPSVCGSYECGLLRRYKAGEVPLEEALARVDRVTRMAEDLRRRVPAASPPRPLWDDAREHLRDLDAAGAPRPGEQEAIRAAMSALRAACREGLDP